MGESPRQENNLSQGPQSDRLDAWKEIAAYLDRDVRTVIRWEKNEGLPVHRHTHHKQATVYAARSEIDAWLENRDTSLDKDDKEAVVGVAGAAVPAATQTQGSYFWPVIVGGPGIIIVLLALFWPFTATAPEEAIDSIAVLPFENVTGDPELEYLSDGTAQSIIHSLSQLPEVKVISFSSAVRYRGQDIQEVTRELDVDVLLVGRVDQKGDNLSINTELVDPEDDTVLWGNQYNRKLAQILAIQEEIAKDISEKLRLQLGPEGQELPVEQGTENPEAYQAYLKGRHHWAKLTPEELERAIEYFNQAIARDPDYAEAYTGLADSYFLQTAYSGRMIDEVYPLEMAAVNKALEIDPTLAEAYSTLAGINSSHEWDFEAAEVNFKRAIELNPNYARAHQNYANSLMRQGRFDEAAVEIEKALALDPLSLQNNRAKGSNLSRRHRYDEAIEYQKRTLEIHPNSVRALSDLFMTYWRKGTYEEALAVSEKIDSLRGTPNSTVTVFHRHLASGNRREAIEVLEGWHGLTAWLKALRYARLGEEERTLQALEEAVDKRSSNVFWANVWPEFDFLRDDPRFQDLLRRMNLAP